MYESSFNISPLSASEIESNSISGSEVYTAVKSAWKRGLLAVSCAGGSGDLVDILRIAIDTVCEFVNVNKPISFFTSVSLSELQRWPALHPATKLNLCKAL